MNDIFGLAFSSSALQIVHLSKDNPQLVSIKAIAYSFDFDFDHLFEVETIKALSNMIQKEKAEKKIDQLSLYVTLPFNFALLKKIALPLDIDQHLVAEQVEWELSHYLPAELAEYKIVKTDSSFLFSGYREVLFICLPQRIIQNIQLLAKQSQSTLGKLIVENFSLENYLRVNLDLKGDSQQIISKIDALQVITHFFIKGKYYSSYLNNLFPLKNYSYEEKLLKLLKEHYQNIINTCHQLPFIDKKEFMFFAYGDALTRELLKSLQQNFSNPVQNLPCLSFPEYEASEVAQFIEALGTCIG